MSSRYDSDSPLSFLLPDVYESDGHVDLGRYDLHGNYLSGLVVRGLRSGRDYLCQFTTRDDLLVHGMTEGDVSFVVKRVSFMARGLYDWLWERYRGPSAVPHSVNWGQVSAVLPLELGAEVRGLVRYSDKQFGLVVREQEDVAVEPGMRRPSRDVVYVSYPLGGGAYRWGGGVYRPVYGQLSFRPEVLDRVWQQVRSSDVPVS